MRLRLLLGLALTGLTAFPAEPAPAPKRVDAKELARLQGEWALVKRTLSDGSVCRYKIDKTIGSDENLTFDGSKVVTEMTYCDPTDTLDESVELDPTRSPKWIDLTILDASFPLRKSKGLTRLGLYEFDGGQLRICVSEWGAAKRPTDFEPGEGRDVCEYKRIKR